MEGLAPVLIVLPMPTQVLRFYKQKLKELTEHLRREGVERGEIKISDNSLDDKLNTLRSLAGEPSSLPVLTLPCSSPPPAGSCQVL